MRHFRTSKPLLIGLVLLALFGLVMPEAGKSGTSHAAMAVLGLLLGYELIILLNLRNQSVRVIIPIIGSAFVGLIVLGFKNFLLSDHPTVELVRNFFIALEIGIWGGTIWLIVRELWDFPGKIKQWLVWLSMAFTLTAILVRWPIIAIIAISFPLFFWGVKWRQLRSVPPQKLAMLIAIAFIFCVTPIISKSVGADLLIPEDARGGAAFWGGNFAIAFLDGTRLLLKIFAFYFLIFGIWHWTGEILFGVGRVRAKLLGSYLLTAIAPLVLFACIFGLAVYLFTVTYRSTLTRKILANEERNFEKWITSLTINKQFWERLSTESGVEKHLPLAMLDLYPDAVFDALREINPTKDSLKTYVRVGDETDTVKVSSAYEKGGVCFSVHTGELCMFCTLPTKDFLLRGWIPVSKEFLKKVKNLSGTDIAFNPMYQLAFTKSGEMQISLPDTTRETRKAALEAKSRVFNDGKVITTVEEKDTSGLKNINLVAGGNVLKGVDWKTGENLVFPYTLSLSPKMFYEDVFKPTEDDSLNQGISAVFILLCSCFLIMMVLISWIGWKVAGGINRSVRSLEIGVQELRAGHLQYEMSVEGGAEFRQVAESFNMLTRDIRRMLRELVDKERIEGELIVARAIQSALLPGKLPRLPQIQMAAKSIPAREVGGDYYDILELEDGRLLLVLGDVSGKGIASAMVMARTQSSLRALARTETDLAQLMTALNKALCDGAHPGMFVSLFVAFLDPREKSLEFVNAGHDFPILCNGDKIQHLETGGMILGVFPDAIYEKEKVSVLSTTSILLYTDGLTETKDINEIEFGVERLGQALGEWPKYNSAEEIMEQLFRKIHDYSDGRPAEDDRTAMVLVFS